MLIRLYEALWGVVIVAAFVTYITGYLTTATAVVFGFICAGLIFIGMMGVLPISVSHPPHPRH